MAKGDGSNRTEVNHFTKIARIDAKRVLKRLDSRFEPRVYFAAFTLSEGKSKGVFLDDCPYQDALLENVAARASEINQADPETGSFHTDPGVERSTKDKLFRRAWREAFIEAIQHAANPDIYTTYYGWPIHYREYQVIPILQVQKRVHDSYYHLQRSHYYDREPRADGELPTGTHRYRISRSLIEAVVIQYFIEMADAMGSEVAFENTSLWFIKDEDQLLLAASKSLMQPAEVAGRNFGGLYKSFDACNTISTLKYEGKEGVGRMLFAKRGHSAISAPILFNNPVELQSFGAIRKLLQMASKRLALLCDSDSVYGLGELSNYDESSESVFEVHFTRQFVWDLLHAGKHLMHVKYGQASIRPPQFPEDKLRSDLPRVFPGIQQEAVNRICMLAKAAASQKHGCMLVVSPIAAAEAVRLKTQATVVRPFEIGADVMDLVTSIDGSVLVDVSGVCHAIGVILDGAAAEGCTPERGARYNSAVRYHAQHADALVIIKSEDGMVSVFPDLLPQFPRAEVESRIKSLQDGLGVEKPDADGLRDSLNRIREIEFYLRKEDCELLNSLLLQVEEVDKARDWFLGAERPFVANPRMNESYYS